MFIYFHINSYLFFISFISSAWRSGSHSIQLLLLLLSHSMTTIFSKYSPQTFQIQFLEEASTVLCVGAITEGPHTLHRDRMTPPPPTLMYCTVLYCTVLYYTLLYIGVPHIMINISIRQGRKWVTYCYFYIFCHKTITCGRILQLEVSIDLYRGVLFDNGI